MAKQRVPQFGSVGKYVAVETDATVGAVLGVNLRNPDGSLVTPTQFGASPPAAGQTVVYWRTIQEVPLNVSALANQGGTGLYVITATGESATRSIQPVSGETTVANGDGVSGDPTIGLDDVDDSGEGELQKTQFDSKGRKTGTASATTDDLEEGSSNLYFTDERADERAQQQIEDQKGQANGLASLGPDGKIPSDQIPAYTYRIPVRTMSQLTNATNDLNMFLRVTDAPGGEAIVYSDGTDYRRVSDSSPVI